MQKLPLISDARVPTEVGDGNAYLLALSLRTLRKCRKEGVVNRFLLERALDFIILTELCADRATLAGDLASQGLYDQQAAETLIRTSDYTEGERRIREQYPAELQAAEAIVRQYGVQVHAEIARSFPTDTVLEQMRAVYQTLTAAYRYCHTKTSLPQGVVRVVVQKAWDNVGPWRY